MVESNNRPARERRAIAMLWPYVRRYPGRMFVAAAFLVIAKVATVWVPVAFKDIVDHLDPRIAMLTVPIALIALYGVLRLIGALFGQLRDTVFERVSQRAMRASGLDAFRHLHELSLRFHLDRHTGGIGRDISRGTRGVYNLLGWVVFNIIPTLFEIVVVIALLLQHFDWRYAVITLATMLLYIAVTIWITEWRTAGVRAMNEAESTANARAVDSLLNYETVKYFGNESFEAERYDADLRRYEDAAVKTESSLAVLNGAQALVIAVGLTALMAMAAMGVVAHKLSVGDIVMVNGWLLQLAIPLNMLGFTWRQIKQGVIDMEHMFGLLDEHAEVQDAPGAKPLVARGGEVRFEHVSFRYNPDRAILDDIDFTIPPGQTLAVVGETGAGKSTLSRLLFRFYDVTGGRITIDGQDIRDVTQESLRAAIGIVPQDTVLFNDTIYYNIAYGRTGATREEVEAAARAAHIHDFVTSLPQGYATTVGERGLKLSGGEKQRVAIARALLKHPAILVFDEATSALDTRTEKIIQAELSEIARGRTTLIVAHRLSTIVDADRILVLDRGRVVETGTHAELLARGGRYAALWAMQARQPAEPATA
ncbi:MAG: ABC transporter ATP-binding protein/permease [Xanthomonadales bacterium]|nr:ABC transporter ATP-binding protein/permease [Xanthomonadales bacterium]ODU94792.1 MAG: metal ABC transporter permease [Rhodanobacter sp. SCN 66-43]OJY82779.1 MAG: metal ABC transporter permease [Xanthomonadales bacterium 66-474]